MCSSEHALSFFNNFSSTGNVKHGCWWIAARRIDGKIQRIDQDNFPFEMTYTFWSKGQPDNAAGKEDRIHICKNNNDATNGIETFGWNDHNKDRIDSFICEKKANVVDVFGK